MAGTLYFQRIKIESLRNDKSRESSCNEKSREFKKVNAPRLTVPAVLFEFYSSETRVNLILNENRT